MNGSRSCLLLLAFVAFAAAARAQAPCGGWVEGFELPGLPERVTALVSFDAGNGPRLHAASRLDPLGGGTFPGVLRYEDGQWTPLGTAIPGFDIAALCVFDDGSGSGAQLYAGGRFYESGGLPAAHVVRWNGASWDAVGTGLEAEVNSLHVHDDGSGAALYAVGDFQQVGGAPSRGIARWNGTSWSGVGGGFAGGFPQTMALFDTGGQTVLAIGGVMQVAGGAWTGVALWDGSTLSPLGSTALDAGLSDISALAVHDAGQGPELYAGGYNSGVGSATSSLARWDGVHWQAVGQGLSGTPYSILSFDAGTGPELYAGGSHGAPGGFPAPPIQRFDGTAWSAVGTNLPLGPVVELLEFDDGAGPKLYAGGTFAASGLPAVFNIARLEGAAWTWPGNGLRWSPEALASFDDGSGPALYAAGVWNMGSPATTVFARWTGSQWIQTGEAPNNTPRALAVFDDGSGPALYAGGLFTAIGSQAASYVAKWDGVTWSPVGAGTSFHVYALGVHDDGSGPALYAAGEFTSAGGMPAQSVARWNGTSWSAVGAGIPTAINGQSIFALASFPGGAGGGAGLYAAGNFTVAGGAPGERIVRWDGTSWQSLATVPDQRIWALEVVDEGPAGHALYVGGRFTEIGAITARRIARFDGTTWSALGFGVGHLTSLADEVRDISLFDDGTGLRLHVAGSLRGQVIPYTRMGLQSFDGLYWTAPAEMIVGECAGLQVMPEPDGSQSLFVTGSFERVGTLLSAGIAQFKSCPPPITSFCAGDGVDPFVTNDCPCANHGGPGRGCAWSSNPQGAVLATSGAQDPDTLVLHASGMPAVAPQTVFWKGDAHFVGAVPWGDGIRCIDGALIRLGTKTNVGGAAQYPEAGNASISVRGQTPPGSGAIGYYQTSFRNAAAFCTPNTFNATNGIQVVW